MTIEEIRKNAPDGATHYRVRSNGKIMYYFFDGGDLFIISRRWRLIPSAFRVDNGEIKPLH